MVDINKLRQEQIKYAKKVVIKDEFDKIETIAGCDQAFIGNKVVSEIVVLNAKTLEVLEKKYAITDVKVPYIPTFIFFREGPAILEAYNKLDIKPDVLMMDSFGILHPQRIGMASHIGIILDIPTIGVSRSLICGTVKGEDVYIDKELMGKKLLTKEFANPLYISPGHKITLKTAVELVKSTTKEPHKLPEPLHIAHRMVKKVVHRLQEKQAGRVPIEQQKEIKDFDDEVIDIKDIDSEKED